VTQNEQILAYYRQVKAKALSLSSFHPVRLRIEDGCLIISALGPYGEIYEEMVEGVGTPNPQL
jgi:hypothetical protein